MKEVTAAYISAYADFVGLSSLWQALTEAEQKRIARQAAVIVNDYTKGVLDTIDDALLEEAIAEQALHIVEHKDMYDARAKISVVTKSSYSDGIISVGGLNSSAIAPRTKNILHELFIRYGLFPNQIHRA